MNAAQHAQGSAIAPGELVNIVGAGFGPAEQRNAQPDSEGRYPTELAGVAVRFNGTPAPILSVRCGEALVQAPDSGATPGTLDVEITATAGGRAALQVQSFATHFAFFSADGSGFGQAAAINQDGTINSPANPAPLGSAVSLFGTGGGALDPPLEPGRLSPEPARVVSPVIAAIPAAGADLAVEYAGAAPGLVGLNQLNLRLPESLPQSIPADTVGISVYFGTPGRVFLWPSPAVTIAVKR